MDGSRKLSDQQTHTWYIDTVAGSAAPVEITGGESDRSILAFDAPHARVVWGQPVQYNAAGHDQTVITMTGAQGNASWLVTLLDGKVESADRSAGMGDGCSSLRCKMPLEERNRPSGRSR